MKAVVFETHGDVDALAWRDWPDPQPAPNEVLIKIQAAALNGFDPMVLRGIPTLKTPLPMIPGGDMAGTIAALGAEVPAGAWTIGDRVLVMPWQPGLGMMGETLRGGFCELVAIPHEHLVRMPDEVSFIEAAALPVAYGAAHRMMVTRGRIAAGERVVVLGATGGVGTCCVQLAKAAGAEVVACTSAADKTARLKEIGADHVINTSTHDTVEEVIRLYGKPRIHGPSGGTDVVVNYIGGDSWAKSLRMIKRGGRMLTCGATSGYDPKTDIRYIWCFELNIVGSNSWSIEDLETLLRLVATKRLKPVIDSIRPMREARAAMQDIVDRKVFGKAMLVP